MLPDGRLLVTWADGDGAPKSFQVTIVNGLDQPVTVLAPISVQEAIDTAIDLRPEIVQAKRNLDTSDINSKFARNQLLPTLSFQGTMGMAGLGSDYPDSVKKNFSGDYYNYGAGLVLSFMLSSSSVSRPPSTPWV